MIPGGWRAVLATALVAAAAVFLALPAGGAGAGGQLLARSTAFTALVLAAFAYDGRAPLARVAPVLLALAAIAVLGLAQSLSWPRAVVEVISPQHAELAARSRESLAAGGAAAASRGVALSLAPQLSRSAALTVASTGAFLAAAFVAGHSRRRRRWLALGLVGGGVFQVLYGLRDWLAGSAPRLRGTFVNPNHLAYSLEIALAVALAWATWAAYTQRYHPRLERKLLLVAPPVGAWLLFAAGLLWTGSRAGLAAAAAGILVQFFLLAPAIRKTGRRLVPKAFAASTLALLLLFVARGSGRISETTLYEVAWGERAAVWRASLELWSRFPISGSGLGTFGEAFPLVQPAATTEPFWRRAHNDPIELLATGGVVAAALGLVALLALVRPLLRVVRAGFRTEDRAAGLAALGALASVVVHEVMDFGLTLPGVALPLAALVGAAAAARVKKRSPATTPGLDESADGRTEGPRGAGESPG